MKEKILGYIKENRGETVAILFITLCALILRLVMLKNYGDLWLDELYSWYFANQKNVFLTVFELIKQDLHMPLYFIILHFWIKIFGQSDTSMHLCTLTLTLPLIPISYYLMKHLFNKTTGYFAAIMFAINTFCMYYSLEVRFYGMVFVLSLLSAFLFVKMIENFDKKYSIAFIVAHSLLMYTFSITPLLTFCYALVGIVYIYSEKGEYVKPFLKNFGLIALIAVPSVIFTIYNFVIMHTTLCSFTKDIYVFNLNIIYDILENFFTCENFQLVTRNINVYRDIFSNLKNPLYVVFVGIPVIIGLSGFVKSFFAINDRLRLFLFPSLIFFMFSILLGGAGVISFLTRYSSIIYPVFICAACFGLSQYKNKILTYGLFAIFVIFNCLYIFLTPYNLFSSPRMELGNLTQIMNERIKPSDNDLILIPYSGSKVMRYIPHGKFIEFCADDALLLKDQKSVNFYFDRKFHTFLNRNNIKSFMSTYINSNSPFELYEIRLRDFYFNKMEKGQKFIIISYRDSFTMPLIKNWNLLKDSNVYDSVNMFVFLMSMITNDSIMLAEKYLTPVDKYFDEAHDYSIFVFEKR